MVFSVKYRKSDGTLDTLEVEAASRAAVFPLLEKRGIKAIKVDDGPAKRGGWNHPQRAKSAARSSRPSPFRGLIAGLIVCILAIGAYFAFFSGSEKPQKDAVEKKQTKIKEVTPAAAPTNAAPVKKVLTKEEKRKKEIAEIEAKWAGKEMPMGMKTHLYFLKHPPTETYHHTGRFDYLRHPCERQIASFLTTEPGTVYIQQPTFDASFDRDFQNAFVDKIDILDTDTEEVKKLKQDVEAVKKELFETCRKDGRLPSEVMNEHGANMYQLGKAKAMLEEEIQRAYNDPNQTKDDIEVLYQAANKMLKDKGVEGFAMPNLMRLSARTKVLERRKAREEARALENQNQN